MSEKARRNDRDQGRRTSSGPAANAPRQKAGHMTAADQAAHNAKNRLPTGAVHIWAIMTTGEHFRQEMFARA